MNHRKTSSAKRYEIVVKGVIDQRWKEWFGDVNITKGENHTTITGTFADQAALHGILNKIRDLNLVLLKLEQLSPE